MPGWHSQPGSGVVADRTLLLFRGAESPGRPDAGLAGRVQDSFAGRSGRRPRARARARNPQMHAVGCRSRRKYLKCQKKTNYYARAER